MDAATEDGSVVGEGTISQRHSTDSEDTAALASEVTHPANRPAMEREPFEREAPSLGNLHEAKRRGTDAPLDDSCRCPSAHDGQRARYHRQASGIALGAVIGFCKGIVTRHQGNSIRLSVGIRRGDGVNEAYHSTRACWTRKLGGLARLPVPEEAEKDHEDLSTAPHPRAPTAPCHLLPIGVHKVPFVRGAMRDRYA